MIIDIHSKSDDSVARNLSNFALLGEFEFRGCRCLSIEGPLQALKVKDADTKRRICEMEPVRYLKVFKKAYDADWRNRKNRHLIDTDGKQIKRCSAEHAAYITELYNDAYEQRPQYRQALRQAVGHELQHSIGQHDPFNTVLTNTEFFGQLNRLLVRLFVEYG